MERFRRAYAAWRRFHEALGTALPCSEVHAATSSSLFCMKLLLHGRDFMGAACRSEFVGSLQAFHEAYGGGASVWQVWHRKMFPREMLEAAAHIWSKAHPEHEDALRLDEMD
eukprot:TRINITY_DN91379_c0_g1_i1.p1 TRINITY_DN91379_c0_g1~~TRINITY_DN91379_c0_g1_i1.p1  ORF type:complete len:119 (-),score=32.06 TRINITY_DN91379_c0_g1_i1:20-355(-)